MNIINRVEWGHIGRFFRRELVRGSIDYLLGNIFAILILCQAQIFGASNKAKVLFFHVLKT